MIMHNKQIDKMLLYKGMEPLEQMLGGWSLRTAKLAQPQAAAAAAASEQGARPEAACNCLQDTVV
jgi:hypothetical protein